MMWQSFISAVGPDFFISCSRFCFPLGCTRWGHAGFSGLIEGPPGTGKTHVLACMLIALMLEAWHRGSPLRLAVSALTHQAIDNLLAKIHELLRSPLV